MAALFNFFFGGYDSGDDTASLNTTDDNESDELMQYYSSSRQKGSSFTRSSAKASSAINSAADEGDSGGGNVGFNPFAFFGRAQSTVSSNAGTSNFKSSEGGTGFAFSGISNSSTYTPSRAFVGTGGVVALYGSNPTLLISLVTFIILTLSISIWISVASKSINDNIFDFNYDDDSLSSQFLKGNIKPHIIFILADDMGWNSIGYENFDLDFATPTLNAMASEGVVMTQFYAQEVCTPARGALLTGRYPLTIGMQFSMVQTAIPWGLELPETTIAEVLKADNYSTHMLGKWHLGHYSPRALPTARGFDTYTGFVNGEQYYWSKRNPDHTHFKDMIYSNTTCYAPYTNDDLHTYSTFFYRDKAVDLINEHNQSSPFFLYLAFQAVHDPFVDINIHQKGIPKEYVSDEMYSKLHSEVVGRKRRQYAMALIIMDEAINSIVEALDDNGMLEHSIVIFASDNGGCYGSGGKNGPLRGTKGSLFEGGTKVDSVLWSPLFPESLKGVKYGNIFHISDWFPTILAMTQTNFEPQIGYELDGVSHLDAILYNSSTPRDYMLYNCYYSVDRYFFDMWKNGSFAVRNAQYKLVHTFNSSIYAQWYQPEEFNEDDDAITTESRCASSANTDGNFIYWLFDLKNDPYEKTNLYYVEDDFFSDVKEELYAKLDEYKTKAFNNKFDFSPNLMALKTWEAIDDYMVPYVKDEDLEYWKGSYPDLCYTPTKQK